MPTLITKTPLVVLSVLLLFLIGCQGSLQETEYQKIREANRTEKAIVRADQDKLLQLSIAESHSKSAYPWESTLGGDFALITKEFFRCRGDAAHPSYEKGKERVFDCPGSIKHSLPLKDKQEYIYPILIELLNYVQKELHAQVIITCGHRCPQHNRYSDPSEYNQTSKHMLGAEVDFYVKGYEHQPLKVVEAIMGYYNQPKFKNHELYKKFLRYNKRDVNVTTAPWFNEEIFIKLYQSQEGRDGDNQHSYPYISIQVRYDSETQSKVNYSWKQAFNNYLRY